VITSFDAMELTDNSGVFALLTSYPKYFVCMP